MSHCANRDAKKGKYLLLHGTQTRKVLFAFCLAVLCFLFLLGRFRITVNEELHQATVLLLGVQFVLFALLDRGLVITQDLVHHLVLFNVLAVLFFRILLGHAGNLFKHVTGLLILLFLFKESDFLTLFDLVTDDGGTGKHGPFAFLLPLCYSGNICHTVRFHAGVHLGFIPLQDDLDLALFLELLITDRHALGLENHLVQVLDFVLLLIELQLCFGEQVIVLRLLFDFNVRKSVRVSPLRIHLFHARLARLGHVQVRLVSGFHFQFALLHFGFRL